MRNTESGVYRRAVAGLRWIAVSKVLVQAATWVMTILSVRLLHPSDYGIVAMSGLVTVFLNLILEGGVGVSIVQKRETARDVLAGLNTALLAFALLASACVIGCAPYVAEYFKEPALVQILRVASIQFPLAALTVVPNALLVRDMRFKEIAVSQTITAVLQGVLSVQLAYGGHAYWALIYSTLFGMLTRLLLVTWFARPPIKPNFGWSKLGRYLQSGRLLLGQRFIWFIVEEADRFVVARSVGVGATGSYMVAKNLSHTFLDRIAEIVNQVSLPAFAAKQDDDAAWRRGFIQLQSLAATLAFPVFWGLAAVAPTVLPLLLGTRWTDTTWVFSLFCFVLPLRVWYSLVDTAIVASGRNRLAIGNVVIWMVVLLPLFFFAARFGVTAVAGAWVIGFGIVYLIVSSRIAATVGISRAQMWKVVAGPALYAGIMTLVALAVGYALGKSLHPVAVAAAQILIGAFVYFALMWSLGRERFRETVRITLSLVGRH
jgi:PST family polysaccharide transporter